MIEQVKFDGTYGLFAISFVGLTKVCLNQWRLQVETQILKLINLFIESDENADGVLTLQEFTVLMKGLEEKDLRKEEKEEKNLEPTLKINRKTRMTKERIIYLFNEALEITQIDLSLMNERQKQAVLEGDNDTVDKISPLAFTKMIMKNEVGGFGMGQVFSDLRYTLRQIDF